MTKRKITFLLIPIIWLSVIWGIVAYKENQLAKGFEVVLKTLPVDPRDITRGEYVALRYDISNILYTEYPSMLANNPNEINVGDTVYVKLADNGQVEIKYGDPVISKKKPASYGELYIKGTVTRKNLISPFPATEDNQFDPTKTQLTIQYGIESYFVPEGTGGDLEARSRNGDLKVHIVIDKDGNSIIKSIE